MPFRLHSSRSRSQCLRGSASADRGLMRLDSWPLFHGAVEAGGGAQCVCGACDQWRGTAPQTHIRLCAVGGRSYVRIHQRRKSDPPDAMKIASKSDLVV